jgi:sporulation protein YlmC with PRC-barrel domain
MPQVNRETAGQQKPGTPGQPAGMENMENPSLAAGERGSVAEQATKEEGGGSAGVLGRLAQSGGVRDQLASAVERVEDACASDIQEFCGDVTPGGGRMALCMRAHQDLLSRRCRFTLFRVSRNIRQAVSDVANECLNGLKSQCGDAQNIGECAEQKSAAISPSCHAVVAALRHAGEKLAALQDMPVYSQDGKDLGRVVDIQRDQQGRIQSVQIQIGRFLGLGDKVVTIGAGRIQQMADRLRLNMNADEVRQLPETKR